MPSAANPRGLREEDRGAAMAWTGAGRLQEESSSPHCGAGGVAGTDCRQCISLHAAPLPPPPPHRLRGLGAVTAVTRFPAQPLMLGDRAESGPRKQRQEAKPSSACKHPSQRAARPCAPCHGHHTMAPHESRGEAWRCGSRGGAWRCVPAQHQPCARMTRAAWPRGSCPRPMLCQSRARRRGRAGRRAVSSARPRVIAQSGGVFFPLRLFNPFKQLGISARCELNSAKPSGNRAWLL